MNVGSAMQEDEPVFFPMPKKESNSEKFEENIPKEEKKKERKKERKTGYTRTGKKKLCSQFQTP